VKPIRFSKHALSYITSRGFSVAEVDALRITFRQTTVTSKHLAEGIAADYDSEGRLAGLEILDAQKRFGGNETMRRVEVEGIGV
jgi:uncharacterized protein YuzE